MSLSILAPTPMSSADSVNTMGAGATIAVVCFVLLCGASAFWEMAQEWWEARTAAATFTDDHIPNPADVAAIDRALPQFGTNHKETHA